VDNDHDMNVWRFACAALAAAVLSSSIARAQDTTAALEERLAAYRHLLRDWAGLTRYGSEDSEVPPPAPGERRVVFIGDQITELWGRGVEKFFPGKPYYNRGIAGQTSPQMLVRFRQDVIALQPKAVVIEAGTNDIAGLTGPGSRGNIADHIMSMTDLAKANGIRVILASILPVCDCGRDQTSARPPARISDVNAWMKGYAASAGALYLDYYSALADGRTFRKDLTVDGLLPNDAGYRVMAPLAERAIDEALGK
jgi:lysophospholipase L1-like esterase